MTTTKSARWEIQCAGVEAGEKISGGAAAPPGSATAIPRKPIQVKTILPSLTRPGWKSKINSSAQPTIEVEGGSLEGPSAFPLRQVERILKEKTQWLVGPCVDITVA